MRNMEAEPVVVVDRVIKIYESGAERVTALKEVSLSVMKGEVVTIMGPSGSGKTTLLNLIAGVDRPSAGRVIVNGKDLTRMDEEQLRLYRLLEVGYVFQEHNLIPTLTALENVLLPMTLAGKRDKERALQLIRSVGLEGKEHRYPEQLSGGEQQRLAVAVALANDPQLIIADEPTGELDLVTGEKVVRLLLDQAKLGGKTVIITTHDPRVARMTDRVVLLEDGRIRGSYRPSRIPVSGTGGEEEIAAERIIVEHLKRLLEDAKKRKEEIAKKIAEGKITLDEAVSMYLKVKSLEEAILEELTRLGAGSEVLGR